MMFRLQTHAHVAAFNNKGIIFSNDIEHHKIHRSGRLVVQIIRSSVSKGIDEIFLLEKRGGNYQEYCHKAIQYLGQQY